MSDLPFHSGLCAVPGRDCVCLEAGAPCSWHRGTLPACQSMLLGTHQPGEVPFRGAHGPPALSLRVFCPWTWAVCHQVKVVPLE